MAFYKMNLTLISKRKVIFENTTEFDKKVTKKRHYIFLTTLISHVSHECDINDSLTVANDLTTMKICVFGISCSVVLF